MTAQEYKNNFNIDKIQDPDRRDHREFLRAFGQEFNELTASVTTYKGFQEILGSLDQKFREIRGLAPSKKKKLNDKLWKAFYAIYVVPKRKALFPDYQAKIEANRYGNHQRVN